MLQYLAHAHNTGVYLPAHCNTCKEMLYYSCNSTRKAVCLHTPILCVLLF